MWCVRVTVWVLHAPILALQLAGLLLCAFVVAHTLDLHKNASRACSTHVQFAKHVFAGTVPHAIP